MWLAGCAAMPMPTFPLVRLGGFRAKLHACYTRRADALFELGDALLCAQTLPSLPHLSLEPVCRRGWGSVYAALARGRIDTERLRDLLVDCLPPADPLVFAVDVTTWPRCDAECSPCRGYYYHPSRHSAGQPIIAGWAWQWIAQLGFDRDSWTAPVDAQRLHPLDDTDRTAAAQVRALLARLPDGADGPVPLVVFDAGYDSAQLSLDLADARVAVLVRLRSDRCFYADPPPRPPGAGGRPRRHGAKFNCADPTTWPAPTATLHTVDDQYGTVTVMAWSGLHPKQQRHPGHGSRGPRPIVRGTIIRVAVERVPAKTRPPKVLWLWWAGPGGLDLDLAWRAYIRRFDLEHTVRFCKQTLGWTTPRPRTPEQADRWTWLVLAAYTQLRLARQAAADQRLPWERPRPPGRLSPVRVCRGFPRLLAALGSPAAAPKPAGRSPGRPKGRASGPAVRYPAIKKPATKPRKMPSKTTKAA
jgi:hypothetical protein